MRAEPEFIKDLENGPRASHRSEVTQKLWRVRDRYLITSAVIILGEPETYVFSADDSGKITDWGELPGSFKGDLNHREAIDGYVLALPAIAENA